MRFRFPNLFPPKKDFNRLVNGSEVDRTVIDTSENFYFEHSYVTIALEGFEKYSAPPPSHGLFPKRLTFMMIEGNASVPLLNVGTGRHPVLGNEDRVTRQSLKVTGPVVISTFDDPDDLPLFELDFGFYNVWMSQRLIAEPVEEFDDWEVDVVITFEPVSRRHRKLQISPQAS